MARDGQGNYNPPLNNWNPAVYGNEADPAGWNQLLADLTSALSQSVSADGQTILTGNLKMGGNTLQGMGAPAGNGQALRRDQLIKGPNIASASTITIPVEGSVFEVTGTTTINQLSGSFDGRCVILVFQSELQITHGPNLRLPNAQNITTATGDAYMFYRQSSSVWACFNMGLGTAATRDVTTSATDTTSGRVPTVGWMGLGAQHAPSTTEANKDDPRPAGFYGAGTNTITPFPTTANILHLAGYGNYQAQIAVGLSTGSTPRMFLRNYDDGTWRGPVEIYHSGNFNPGTAATRDVGTSSGTVAAGDDPRITGAAQKSANLSDLTNASTARNNLGLGNSATRDVGTSSGTVAAGNDSRITGAAQKSANLSDLTNSSTARANLGLGTAATRDVGTSSGNVMEVGAFGLGTIHPPSLSLTYDSPSRFFNASGDEVPNEWGQGGGVNNEHTGGVLIQRDYRPLALFFGNRLELKLSRYDGTRWQPAVTVHHTGNILKTTGNNNDFPISQKAVTDAINNSAIGVGQTWQNVASSRAPGTTYTNTTGRTIMVYIAFDPDGTSSTITLGSVQMPFSVDTTREYASFIVPPGLTYRLSAAGTNSPLTWLELR